MSQLQMDKPSLPSIQFLLQEAPGPIIPKAENNNDTPISVSSTPKRQFGHRASRSVSSLPLDLQSLSLQAPEDMIVSPTPPQPQQRQAPSLPAHHHEPYSGIPFSSTEKAPSWMIPNDRSPMLNIPLPTSVPPSSSSSSLSFSTTSSAHHHNRRKPSFAGHGRSVSEFTLPPLSSSTTMNNTPPPPSTTATRRSHGSSHRRAVSANTIDFMLSPSPSLSSMRAQSYSPKEQTFSSLSQSSSPPQQPTQQNNSNFFEQLDVASTADTSGRYVCPYCQKKFSRPSSLRIHTYSHTGEKPFVCTEPGCGRHFSVQSNMRRHLRVHRLGRGSSNSNSNSNGLETTNEE